MGRMAKISIVISGYVAAVVAAIAAAWLYDWRTSKLPYDTSGGMYAGGEAMTSIAVFLVVALVPTLVSLWFLRGNARFWNLVGVGAMAFAAVSLASVFSVIVHPEITRNVLLTLLSLLALAQLLGAPFWFASMVLFWFLAPTRPARRMLRAAIVIEGVIGVVALVHWFVPASRF
jgi:hypothetical protein